MTPKSDSSSDDSLRHHSFDGIQEYDKKLPNWWLKTFYGAIIYAICYWIYYAQSTIAPSAQANIANELNRIQAVKFASTAGTLDDEGFWKMSRNPEVVASGQKTFLSTCASCHGDRLQGGIGANLVDRTWIHGGRPTDIYTTVTTGVAIKGMPTWGPVLGAKKISELVAFIVSKHDPSEPEMQSASLTAIQSAVQPAGTPAIR